MQLILLKGEVVPPNLNFSKNYLIVLKHCMVLKVIAMHVMQVFIDIRFFYFKLTKSSIKIFILTPNLKQ